MTVILLSFFVFLSFSPLHSAFPRNFLEINSNIDDMFKKLVKKYENEPSLTESTKAMIDNEVYEDSKRILGQLQSFRSEKKNMISETYPEGYEVFNSFEETLRSNASDTLDISFFKIDSDEEEWFGVILTPSHIEFHRIKDNIFHQLETPYYPSNASRITTLEQVDSVFIFVWDSLHVQILIFHSHYGKFIARALQRVEIHDITDVSVWRFSGQSYFGISSSSGIWIYAWVEDSFRIIQKLPFGANLLNTLQIEKSIYLICADERKTSILQLTKGNPHFSSVQIIRRPSHHIATLTIKKASSEEYILSLSNIDSTVLYKISKSNVFVPFQKIVSTDSVIPIPKNESAHLIIMKDHKLETYRYDGWWFVKSNFRVDGIKNVKLVIFRGEQQILVRTLDGVWSLKRINWMKPKIPRNSYQSMKNWCSAAKNRAKNIRILLTEMHASTKNLGKIQRKLEVTRANAEDMEDLTSRYDRIVSRLNALNESIHHPKIPKLLHLSGFWANLVNLRCTGKCTVKKLVSKLKCDFLSQLKKPNDETQIVKLERVKVDKLEGFLCPVAGVKIAEISVGGLVNGLLLEDLVKNALRRSGGQIVTGEHVLANLHTSSLRSPSVELASNSTRQRIRVPDSIQAEELELIDGGLLLPLDGKPVTMAGLLRVAKAKFDGLVQLRCRPRGHAVSRIAPSIDFLERQELVGNYTLGNVRIVSEFQAKDAVGNESGKTFSRIGEAAIPLDETRLPVKLVLQQNQTIWSNITVEDLPKLLTKNNSQMVTVTGMKVAVNDVTLSNSLYSKLPLPKLKAKVCSMRAVTPDIRTSTISVDYAQANVVISENVYGAKELDDSISDSVISLKDVDLSRKSFSGSVFVQDVRLKNVEESPFYCFQRSKFMWYSPDTIEHSFKLNSLKLGSLNVTCGLKIPAPANLRNMIVNGNLQVNRINGIVLESLVRDIVHIDDDVFLHSAQFDNLEVEDVETFKANINLQNLQRSPNLGKKTIHGDLIIDDDLTLQNFLSYPSADRANTYVIHGSVTFLEEPNIEYINGKRLSKLISDTWMLDHSTIMTGHFVFKNVTLTDSSETFESLSNPSLGMWKKLKNRVLSRTKSQIIGVPAHIQSVTVPNAITQGNSSLQTADLYLNELFFMTLKKNANVTIQHEWHFEELNIQGGLEVRGRVNNLNLSSDIARHDVKLNVVTGKKVVEQLTVRNLDGLHFGEWVEDTLNVSDNDKISRIKGKKTFNTFNARLLNVSGTILGKDIQKCLMKFGDQNITAAKNIEGLIHSPSSTVNGLVNELNLTDFTKNHLKKQGLNQTVKSDIVFESTVQIMGNLTVGERIQGIAIEEVRSMNESFTPILNGLASLEPVVIGIDAIMKRRAKYWSKFEIVKEDAWPQLNDVIDTSDYSEFNDIFGECSLVNPLKLLCGKSKEFFLKYSMDSTEVLLNKTLFIEALPVLVQIGSGLRSKIIIHVYDPARESFDVALNVRAPGMTKAAISSLDNIIWIGARLHTEMLIIRFQPSTGEARKYHLSESRLIALKRVPMTNELVLVRDDGFWKLEGLAGPTLVFEVGLDAYDVEFFATEHDFFVGLRNSLGKRTRLLKARFEGF